MWISSQISSLNTPCLEEISHDVDPMDHENTALQDTMNIYAQAPRGITVTGTRAEPFHLHAKDLRRLNDALRSSGLQSLPHDAKFEDVVSHTIEAINGLVSKAALLSEYNVQKSTRKDERSVPVAHLPVVVESDFSKNKSSELDSVLKENKELRKLVMQWKSEANSLSHLLKSKEKEVDRLQNSLRDKVSEDDKRSALSMMTIREHNMPSSSLIYLNNLQKRISELERENEVLSRPKSSLKSKDADYEAVLCELEETKTRLTDMTNKYYSAVEERNEARKTVIRDDSQNVSKKIANLIGEDQDKALKTVADMKRVVTEIFPPIDAFVTRVSRMVEPGMTGPITQQVLGRMLDRIVQWAQDSADLGVVTKNSGPMEAQEKLLLHRLKGMQTRICEIFGLQETPHSDTMTSYLSRVKFKCDEFRNFYKLACIELGMSVEPKGAALPTYNAFMAEMRKQIENGSGDKN